MAIPAFFLINSPTLSASWLDPVQIRFLELRQQAHQLRGDRPKGSDRRLIFKVLTDWKIYLFTLANWSNTVPNYALKFTMPQIIKNMGFTAANAQLLTIPPYAVGAISACSFSLFADRYRWRMPSIVGPELALVVAFAILFSKAADIKNNIGVCYFAICLACAG